MTQILISLVVAETFFYVVLEFVIGTAFDKFNRGTIDFHEVVQGVATQAGESNNERAIEAVIDVGILFFLKQAILESKHTFVPAKLEHMYQFINV